jgi:hypothetical protein
MPIYKAIAKGYIEEVAGQGRIVPKGEIFEFKGKPGLWMEPGDDEAKKAKEEAAKPVEGVEDDANRQRLFGYSGPPRIKSHPTLPNPEGSSGEEEGDDVPYAAIKRQEREIAAQNAAAFSSGGDDEAPKKRGRPKAWGKRGKVKAVPRKVRPQSDAVAPADDAGTE